MEVEMSKPAVIVAGGGIGAKSPNGFYDGLQWLYGGTGLAA